MADTPQFDLPFTGAEVEQDSIEEVTQSVETLLRTPLGMYDENPDYGVVDPTFTEGDVNLQDIQVAISTWEDRADVLLEQDTDALDSLVRRVRINESVRSQDA